MLWRCVCVCVRVCACVCRKDDGMKAWDEEEVWYKYEMLSNGL